MGVRRIMNIFHKLDIHYPGTDIRAEAPGSWLGEGAALHFFPTTSLQPRVTVLQRESSLPTAWRAVGGGGISALSFPCLRAYPIDLEATASLSGSRRRANLGGVCREGGSWPAQDPRAVGGTGPSLRYRRGRGIRRGKASGFPPSARSSDGGESTAPGW